MLLLLFSHLLGPKPVCFSIFFGDRLALGVTWSREGGENVKSPSWRSVGLRAHDLLAGEPSLPQLGVRLKLCEFLGGKLV